MTELSIEQLEAQLARAKQKKARQDEFEKAVAEKSRLNLVSLKQALIDMEVAPHKQSMANINALFDPEQPKEEKPVPEAFREAGGVQ